MSKGKHRQHSRGRRQSGFDDDNYSVQDARDERQGGAYSAPPRESAVGQGPVLEGTVKMFNPEKGFGFVALTDGSGDAFLHIGTLQAAGHEAPSLGMTLRVQVGAGPKGPQVTAVLKGDSGHSAEAQSRPAPRRAPPPDPSTAKEVEGTIKWFSPDKGFGFVKANDGGTDVFLHASVIEEADLQTLAEGSAVSMRVVETEKGRQAISIALA